VFVRPQTPSVAPHVPLSQSAFLWHTAALVEQVPAVEPVPAPQELLSQSVFLWHAVAFVEQLPAVDPVPEPHVPEVPHCESAWHAAPPLHVPPVVVPHVPSPQSAFL
jgi:hypothetical protein